MLTTQRLTLRPWRGEDLDFLAALCADPVVMEHFPRTLSREESREFIERQTAQHDARGYCYFAAEWQEAKRLIGFVGLSDQTYDAPFNPSVDIGWRIHPDAWGRGLATEGAAACLAYAFDELGLDSVVSVAPTVNVGSIRVMEKIGMRSEGTFKHSALGSYPFLETCALYRARRPAKTSE